MRHEKPTKDTEVAEQFIAMAHWANYVAFSMSTVDIDAFEAWVEAMMEGPQRRLRPCRSSSRNPTRS